MYRDNEHLTYQGQHDCGDISDVRFKCNALGVLGGQLQT